MASVRARVRACMCVCCKYLPSVFSLPLFRARFRRSFYLRRSSATGLFNFLLLCFWLRLTGASSPERPSINLVNMLQKHCRAGTGSRVMGSQQVGGGRLGTWGPERDPPRPNGTVGGRCFS